MECNEPEKYREKPIRDHFLFKFHLLSAHRCRMCPTILLFCCTNTRTVVRTKIFLGNEQTVDEIFILTNKMLTVNDCERLCECTKPIGNRAQQANTTGNGIVKIQIEL